MKVIHKVTGEIFDVEEIEDNRDGTIYYKRVLDGRIYHAILLQSLQLLRIEIAKAAMQGFCASPLTAKWDSVATTNAAFSYANKFINRLENESNN